MTSPSRETQSDRLRRLAWRFFTAPLEELKHDDELRNLTAREFRRLPEFLPEFLKRELNANDDGRAI